MQVTITVNGEAFTDEVEPRLLLVYYLRELRKLTGTHIGCDTSNCGACTVLLDGHAVKSCTVLAAQAHGHDVRTVESLAAADGTFSPVQEGFRQEHGLQCGSCPPGMLLACTALLAENPDPSDPEIREALEGNLCRCTGYQGILAAVRWAADHPEGLPA